jgi:hypothetical protein
MKSIKISYCFFAIIISFGAGSLNAQSILGTWQLTKQTTCLANEIQMTDAEDSLVTQMNSRSGASARIVKFKEKGAGEQSVRILNKSKYADGKNFLYRFDGSDLHILDKKSQTLIQSYTVDKLAGDSLIVSNAARPCDT